jgi:ribulose-5-phosphate 4-epimerase/fuculose-1-phosphate aldolase
MSQAEAQAREDICRVGQSLFARGYVHATAGNISVRLSDGFLITPTDACLGFRGFESRLPSNRPVCLILTTMRGDV